MGFLKDLQDFGIGARGPAGRRVSGAQRLAQSVGGITEDVRGRGLNKAIMAAQAEGRIVSPDKMMEVSERWDVPIQRVMQMFKPHNDRVGVQETIKKQQAFWQFYKSKKGHDPSWTPTMNDILNFSEQVGDKDPTPYVALAGKMAMMSPQEKMKVLGKDTTAVIEETDPLSGQMTVRKAGVQGVRSPPPTPKDTRTKEKKLFDEMQKDPEFKAHQEQLRKQKAAQASKGGAGKTDQFALDLGKAQEAKRLGASSEQLIKRMLETHPGKDKEILVALGLPPSVQTDLQDAIARINNGENKAKVFRELAAKKGNVKYRKILKDILMTGQTDATLQALSVILGNK